MLYSNIKVKDLSHRYDADFMPSEEYLKSMPDIQNSPCAPTTPIERVGIHGLHFPLKIMQQTGEEQEVRATITGMVSLEANKAGINMSRILRSFQKHSEGIFSMDKLCDVLRAYKKDLESFDAHIIMCFPYRMWQDALRSVDDNGDSEGGWQYYDVTFDVSLDRDGTFRKQMILDFVYSSACPCSTALAEHAALTRGTYAIPHSQRSVARIALEFDDMIWIEDLVYKCREALMTETLVFCKRQDEQAFAEANASQPKFVEDAARILGKMLDGMPQVKDYKLIISHLESLHSHNAISVKIKNIPGTMYDPYVSFAEFQSLVR